MVETSYFLLTPVRFGAPGSVSAIKSPRGRASRRFNSQGLALPRFTLCCEMGTRCFGDILGSFGGHFPLTLPWWWLGAAPSPAGGWEQL